MKKIFYIILGVVIVVGIIAYLQTHSHLSSAPEVQTSSNLNDFHRDASTDTQVSGGQSNLDMKEGIAFSMPLDRASERITKKLFGTKVSPGNSPVSPERFSGYHTGVDFETFPEEKDVNVEVKAVCEGKLLRKGRASGYGGYAIQSCKLDDQDVTVVYGHLRESSIAPKVGESWSREQKIAVLGAGYSAETDGERNHLHLSIHKGSSINIKGYVQSQGELSGWRDPKEILGL